MRSLSLVVAALLGTAVPLAASAAAATPPCCAPGSPRAPAASAPVPAVAVRPAGNPGKILVAAVPHAAIDRRAVSFLAARVFARVRCPRVILNLKVPLRI